MKFFVVTCLFVFTIQTCRTQEVDQEHDNNLADFKVCETSECKSAGKKIADAIDDTTDPCNNFFQFACGGWMAKNVIPDDKSSFGTSDILDEKVQQIVKNGLSEEVKKEEAKSVSFAKGIYQTCINEEIRESVGVTPLIEVLKSTGGWPLVGKKTGYEEANYSWSNSLAKVIGELNIASIFTVEVGPDANDTLVNRFSFDVASMGLGRNQLVNKSAYPELVNAYRKYITSTVSLLDGSDRDVAKEVEEIIDFEGQLAKFSLPQEDKRDAHVWYNKMSFTDFNKLADGKFDWLRFVNEIYSKIGSTVKVSPSELVIIGEPKYYNNVINLLENTPKRVVANYIGWTVVQGLGTWTNAKFRENEFQFNKVISGVEKQAPLWEKCSAYLGLAWLQYPVSRIYVENAFTIHDKKAAVSMMKDLKEAFRELVTSSSWLDEITKKKSNLKLDKIIDNIGYPDWILSNDQLDRFYNLTKKVNPKNLFDNVLTLVSNKAFRSFEELRKPVNRTLSWPMPPAIVNAAYQPTQNSVTIPAGILKLPFFDSKVPASLNYGGIGAVIGHEITHGFDDQGSQFDGDGNLVNWWSREIRAKFTNGSKCFINQYASHLDEEAKMHLNGVNTVGENIADNGGLREAFKALEKHVQRHGQLERLPYVSQYSPQQLFFLSYANTWCTEYRLASLKQMIQYNPHSPPKYRVNVPVSNFATFSKVFNCKAESKMNPKDKCVLW